MMRVTIREHKGNISADLIFFPLFFLLFLNQRQICILKHTCTPFQKEKQGCNLRGSKLSDGLYRLGFF